MAALAASVPYCLRSLMNIGIRRLLSAHSLRQTMTPEPGGPAFRRGTNAFGEPFAREPWYNHDALIIGLRWQAVNSNFEQPIGRGK
jgi:hypothetical protein